MSKLKTKKAASSRFRVNKKGKVKRAHAGKRHMATGKRRARKRRLRKSGMVAAADNKRIRRLMPYA